MVVGGWFVGFWVVVVVVVGKAASSSKGPTKKNVESWIAGCLFIVFWLWVWLWLL